MSRRGEGLCGGQPQMANPPLPSPRRQKRWMVETVTKSTAGPCVRENTHSGASPPMMSSSGFAPALQDARAADGMPRSQAAEVFTGTNDNVRRSHLISSSTTNNNEGCDFLVVHFWKIMTVDKKMLQLSCCLCFHGESTLDPIVQKDLGISVL